MASPGGCPRPACTLSFTVRADFMLRLHLPAWPAEGRSPGRARPTSPVSQSQRQGHCALQRNRGSGKEGAASVGVLPTHPVQGPGRLLVPARPREEVAPPDPKSSGRAAGPGVVGAPAPAWSQQTQLLAHTSTDHLFWGKPFPLSGPQFPHLLGKGSEFSDPKPLPTLLFCPPNPQIAQSSLWKKKEMQGKKS